MYQTILVERLTEDGARLLKALDERGFPVNAALWYQDPNTAIWKLVLVTPVAGGPGWSEAYSQIQSAMSRLNLKFFLDDIRLMDPNSPTFPDFRRRMEGVVSSSDLQPKDSPVVFHDAYIYRWLN